MPKDLERAALVNRRFFEKERARVLLLLGGLCARCGFSDQRALQIDHVHGGGHRDRTRLNPVAYYRQVAASTEASEGKYQLLCANCNAIKRVENRETSRKYDEQAITPVSLRPCGTPAAYRRGCRCDACREAHNTYCRSRRQKK